MKNFPEQPFDMGDPHGFTCPHASIKEYKDLKLIEGGGHTHPGGRHAGPHLDGEWDFFQKVLDNVDPSSHGIPRHPVMLEIGCLWGLWSMSFKQRFPKGKNILVEPEPIRLGCGLKNFELNGMECIYFHGHCGADTPSKAGGFSEAGEHISIDSIISKTKVSSIDVIHMDAQGAEFGIIPEIKDLTNKGFFKNLVIFTHNNNNNILKILNESPAVEVVETGAYDDPYIYAKAK